MPWLETDAMDERIRFVVRASQPDANVSELCRGFGISRKTGYKWLARAAGAGGLQGIRELSRRPRESPRRIAASLEAAIVDLRKRTGWGGKKIAVVMRERGVTRRTADRVIERNGLVRPEAQHGPAAKRFERSRPNALWQMDFKGEYKSSDGKVFPWNVMDDHSRYIVSLRALHGTAARGVWPCLRDCFERYGLPDAMLMDHGTPWYSTTNSLGLTWVSVALLKQGIRLIFSGIRHPQTQGKIERQHRALNEWLCNRGLPDRFKDFSPLLSEYRAEYNELRPHEALQMAVPASRYQPSPRPFDPRPPEWLYPPGARMYRLSSAGTLRISGGYRFVCEALAREWVQVEQFGERALVVYRDMPIRELNLRTGETWPVLSR